MELWTFTHFVILVPAILIMCIITILLNKCLQKYPIHIRLIPLYFISIVIIILEILKNLYSLITEGYSLSVLPFHFCSVFLFVLPAMCLCRGKYSDGIGCIASTCCMSLVLFMLIYPNLILSVNDFNNFFAMKDFYSCHTVLYHLFAMFALVIIVGLKLHTPTKQRHVPLLCMFIIGFSIIAAIVSNVLERNFSSFYRCNIPQIEEIRLELEKTIGYVFTQIVYATTTGLLHTAFFMIAYLAYLGLQYLVKKIFYKEEEENKTEVFAFDYLDKMN